MEKKIKITVTVLSMLFFVFLINNKVQAVFEIDKFNIDAIVDESGNMNIIETIDYYTNEVVNGVTREIATKNSKNIKNSADSLELKSITVDGKVCSQIDVGTGEKGDEFVFEYTPSSNNNSIKLYTPFNEKTKQVCYKYVLNNVAVKY